MAAGCLELRQVGMLDDNALDQSAFAFLNRITEGIMRDMSSNGTVMAQHPYRSCLGLPLAATKLLPVGFITISVMPWII
jgi:hypothetical protein